MPTEYTSRDLRYADTENDLARTLRALLPQEALEEIRRLIRVEAAVGLRLARRVLRGRAPFEQLLREGLDQAGGRNTLHHLKSATLSLGSARTLALVRQRLGADPDPRAYQRILPWFAMAAPDAAAWRDVNALAEEFAARPGGDAGREWITQWRAWHGDE